MALLHELRLRGAIEVSDSAPAESLLAAGYAVRKREALALTPAGRMAHAAWARLAEGSEAEEHTRRAYDAFLPHNAEMLQVCHDWQVGPSGPNDHRDAARDWAVIERLVGLDERHGPVIRRLGARVPRFAGYRQRLRGAVRRVQDGEHKWFVSPRCDSFHTVWMQLHEDLLLALGLDRDVEAGRPAEVR